MIKELFKWDDTADKIESSSFIIIIISSILTIVGISVGSFIPGVFVALAIIGSFSILVGIFFYIVSQFFRLIVKKSS